VTIREDVLTDSPTDAIGMSGFTEELEVPPEPETSFSVAMIDIDGFKAGERPSWP